MKWYNLVLFWTFKFCHMLINVFKVPRLEKGWKTLTYIIVTLIKRKTPKTFFLLLRRHVFFTVHLYIIVTLIKRKTQVTCFYLLELSYYRNIQVYRTFCLINCNYPCQRYIWVLILLQFELDTKHTNDNYKEAPIQNGRD